VSECAKRSITVVSFGADGRDGDSCELKAMLHSAQLYQTEAIPNSLNVNNLKNGFLGLQLKSHVGLHMSKTQYT